jgi:hypothetical protein
MCHDWDWSLRRIEKIRKRLTQTLNKDILIEDEENPDLAQ